MCNPNLYFNCHKIFYVVICSFPYVSIFWCQLKKLFSKLPLLKTTSLSSRASCSIVTLNKPIYWLIKTWWSKSKHIVVGLSSFKEGDKIERYGFYLYQSKVDTILTSSIKISHENNYIWIREVGVRAVWFARTLLPNSLTTACSGLKCRIFWKLNSLQCVLKPYLSRFRIPLKCPVFKQSRFCTFFTR